MKLYYLFVLEYLTFDNGPNVSFANDSDTEPRNESKRSIFLCWMDCRPTSLRELAFIKDFDEVTRLSNYKKKIV